ncbi:hypothetical protein [Nocardioides houyundeii]|nr:hypothetical protein [Nocardioides houyundeii]
MTPGEHLAALLGPVLGEHFSEVEFADLVDEILDDLDLRIAGPAASASV